MADDKANPTPQRTGKQKGWGKKNRGRYGELASIVGFRHLTGDLLAILKEMARRLGRNPHLAMDEKVVGDVKTGEEVLRAIRRWLVGEKR